MSWIGVVLVSFATSLVSVGLVVVALGGAGAHSGGGDAAAARWAGWAPGSGRHADGGHGACVAAWPAGRPDAVLEHLAADLALSPAQRPTWEAVTAALRSALPAMRAACAAPLGEGDSLARLRRGEALLKSAQTALAEIRPAYEAFYATLTARQRAALERWLAPGHAASRAARR